MQRGNPELRVLIGLAHEFKQLYHDAGWEHHMNRANGIAHSYLQMAYVYIDNIVSFKHISLEGVFAPCWYCAFEGGDGDCIRNRHRFTDHYCPEISIVVIHELVHLCGLKNENEVYKATDKVCEHGFDCPDFLQTTQTWRVS